MSSAKTSLTLVLPPTKEALQYTGERFTPETPGEISHEHLHRYLFALQFCEGKDVLDVASGEGYGTYLLSTVARSVMGVDISQDAVRHAERRYRAANLRYGTGSCTAIPLPNESVDVVVSFETIEHIAEHEDFFGEIRRVLRPRGILVMSSPDKKEYSPPGKPPNPFHVKELHLDEFRALVRRHFAHSLFGGQRAIAGSVVVPLEPAALSFEFASLREGRRLERADALPSPLYVIGVASAVPLPSVRWGLLDEPGFTLRLIEHATALDTARRELATSLAVARSDTNSVRTQLQAELDAAKAELEAATAETAQLRATLQAIVSSRSWVMTQPLREAIATIRRLRGSGSLRTFVWNVGRLAVASFPPGPRERVRALKRRVSRRVTGGDAPGLDSPGFDEPRVATAVKRILASLANGPEAITHVMTVPHLRRGGADLTAMNYLRFVAESHGGARCLLVLADSPALDVPEWIPPGVRTLKVDDLIAAPSARERVDVLHAILLATGARTVHNVNSVAGWNLIIHRGPELSRRARLFGSIFAFQFDERGRTIGYAAEYFERARPHLAGLITDNRRFANDLVATYRLGADWRDKIHVVYNPTRANGTTAPRRVRGAGDPLRVLWAGRIDAEKLPDVLQAVSDRADFAIFDVFGATVVDAAGPRLRPSERLRLRGPYTDLAALFAEGGYDAFLFTSKWEGMPNVLLEVGALGIPVIAPDVGGVRELIQPETGYLVRGPRDVAGYVEALESIRRDPDEASRRAQRLAALVATRHSWDSFTSSMRAIRDYA